MAKDKKSQPFFGKYRKPILGGAAVAVVLGAVAYLFTRPHNYELGKKTAEIERRHDVDLVGPFSGSEIEAMDNALGIAYKKLPKSMKRLELVIKKNSDLDSYGVAWDNLTDDPRQILKSNLNRVNYKRDSDAYDIIEVFGRRLTGEIGDCLDVVELNDESKVADMTYTWAALHEVAHVLVNENPKAKRKLFDAIYAINKELIPKIKSRTESLMAQGDKRMNRQTQIPGFVNTYPITRMDRVQKGREMAGYVAEVFKGLVSKAGEFRSRKEAISAEIRQLNRDLQSGTLPKLQYMLRTEELLREVEKMDSDTERFSKCATIYRRVGKQKLFDKEYFSDEDAAEMITTELMGAPIPDDPKVKEKMGHVRRFLEAIEN